MLCTADTLIARIVRRCATSDVPVMNAVHLATADDPVVARIVRRGVESLRNACKPRRPFVTVGLEGAGHHIFTSMPAELCGGASTNCSTGSASCGGLASFPFRSSWRHQEKPLMSTPMDLTMGLRGRP